MSTLEQRVAALEVALGVHIGVHNRTQAKEWPQVVDEYWCVDSYGTAYGLEWDGEEIDNDLKAIGNIYRTEAEAEAEVSRRKTMTKLREIAARVNGGWVPDWSSKRLKWGIICGSEGIEVVAFIFEKHYNQVYFRTEEGAEQAINELGDELKGLFV